MSDTTSTPTELIGPANRVTSEEGHTYEPWSDGWAVGFKVTHAVTGEERYVYLNPSGGDDRGVACVFLYCGPDGRDSDPSVCYVDVFDEEGPKS